MKKDVKVQKLQLTRETLHGLGSTDLQIALGGATTTKFGCTVSCGQLTCLC